MMRGLGLMRDRVLSYNLFSAGPVKVNVGCTQFVLDCM